MLLRKSSALVIRIRKEAFDARTTVVRSELQKKESKDS